MIFSTLPDMDENTMSVRLKQFAVTEFLTIENIIPENIYQRMKNAYADDVVDVSLFKPV